MMVDDGDDDYENYDNDAGRYIQGGFFNCSDYIVNPIKKVSEFTLPADDDDDDDDDGDDGEW